MNSKFRIIAAAVMLACALGGCSSFSGQNGRTQETNRETGDTIQETNQEAVETIQETIREAGEAIRDTLLESEKESPGNSLESGEMIEKEPLSSTDPDADPSLPDGEYVSEVTLEGGSGKASVESPVRIIVEDGRIRARIRWSSPYYDYMIVDGEKYLNEAAEDGQPQNSEFTIPVPAFEKAFSVIADTTAMSKPHEIEYTLCFAPPQPAAGMPSSEENDGNDSTNGESESKEKRETGETVISSESEDLQTAAMETAAGEGFLSFEGLAATGRLETEYASQFSVDFYRGKQEDAGNENLRYALITIGGSDRFLLVPKGGAIPAEAGEQGITILRAPLDRSYLVSTSVMDMIRAIGAIPDIRLSGTRQEDWDITEAAEAMEREEILYAGKYSAPDYELLVREGCNFAIENTMIYHKPAVKEKLESLGIPVLVERSSYETDPVGRLEWIRLYGVLFGCQEEADAFFRQEAEKIRQIAGAVSKEKEADDSGKRVAFFSVASNGSITVRRPGDYITKIIEMAGGRYALTSLPGSGENTMSTMKMQMEDFYAEAREADILIYNGTIEGELSQAGDLLKKNPLFSEFKAFAEGEIYCLEADCFQHSTMAGELMQDIYSILHSDRESGAVPEQSGSMTFIKKLH